MSERARIRRGAALAEALSTVVLIPALVFVVCELAGGAVCERLVKRQYDVARDQWEAVGGSTR